MEVARVIHAPPKCPPEAGIHESLDHLTLAETNIMSPPYTKPKRHTATTPTDTFSPTPSDDPPQKKTRSRTEHTKVTQTQTTTFKKAKCTAHTNITNCFDNTPHQPPIPHRKRRGRRDGPLSSGQTNPPSASQPDYNGKKSPNNLVKPCETQYANQNYEILYSPYQNQETGNYKQKPSQPTKDQKTRQTTQQDEHDSNTAQKYIRKNI
jgi:hypothetical protein